MRERTFLILWGLLASAGLGALGGASGQKPALKTFSSSAQGNCNIVRYFPVLFRGRPNPYWVDWDLCSKGGDPAENHVKVETRPEGKVVYNFDPADEVQQLERLDLLGDGNEQLLWVNLSSGSGGYINWCVLGWMKERLECWKTPNVEFASRRLLKKDEDFGFKGWVLKARSGRLVLGHGIYRAGEGNCCPSRGGAFVELIPTQGSFQLSRTWRTSKPEYEQWLWAR